MMPGFGTGVYVGLGLFVLSLFVLGVTAFHPDARENETWKSLAVAVVITGLLGFVQFVQEAIAEGRVGAVQTTEGAGNE